MTTSADWPWSGLGLDGPSDRAAIRRAYAARLKRIDQSGDPAGFQRLRQAYADALDRAARREAFAEEPEEPWGGPEEVEEAAPVAWAAAPARTPPRPVPPQDPAPSGTEGQPQTRQEAMRLAATRAIQLRSRIEEEVERLAEGQPLSGNPFHAGLGGWRKLLSDPDLMGNDGTSGMLEHAVYGAVRNRLVAGADGAPVAPHFVSPELTELFDQRFGWLSDYPRFARSFGLGHEAVMLALTARRAPREARVPAPNRRLHWFWQATLLVVAYLVFRFAVLDRMLP